MLARVTGALALTLGLAQPVGAMTGCARDAMLVLDGSASMSEIGFDATAPTRIDDARTSICPARSIDQKAHPPTQVARSSTPQTRCALGG